jgi:dynein heavy chain
LNLLKAFLGVDGMDLRKQNNQNVSKAIATYITFSLTWSLGGNLHESSRKEFNRALRTELKARFSDLPDGDVYEQGVDRQIHQLQPWSE